ncbi:MAG TPA: hypothetical protein EYN79_08915 [Planctomycetes bacterium]|nr:hypothetical protein [Planctomycetota bacterium]
MACRRGSLLLLLVLLLPMVLVTEVASGQYEVYLNDRAASLGEPVNLYLYLDNSAGAAVMGWSWGVCHDPAALELLAVSESNAISGNLPDFYSLAIYADGWTVDAAYELPDAYLQPHASHRINRVTYEVLATELGEESQVCFCSTLGTPPVAVTITEGVGGTTVVPGQECGVVTMNPIFKRGDCNGDGAVDLADSIYLLISLFSAGPPPPCEDACDLDDDGAINIGDAVFGILYLFQGGSEPALPGPNECGPDLPGMTDSYGCNTPPEC